jgi:hypothetical protein
MDKVLSAAILFTNQHGAVCQGIRNLYFVSSLRLRFEFVQ